MIDGTEEYAATHFAYLAAQIEKGAACLEREAEQAERDGNAIRAQAKRNGAAAAREYATHVATEWSGQSWANLSEEAQVYAHACQMSGILMDPITAIKREKEQEAKGYSFLSGPQINIQDHIANRSIYLRLEASGRFVRIDEEIDGIKQLPFFAITGYYQAASPPN